MAMRRYLPLTLAAVLVVAGPACETGDETRVLRIDGFVRDYFSNAALPGVLLDWDDPTGRTVTSSGIGAYQITGLMETDIVFVSASLANYVTTRNEPVILGTSNAVANQAVIAAADANRQYTGLSLTPVAGRAMVVVNLLDPLGQPHAGLPLADIVIADTADDPVGTGPFVFGAAGDLVDQGTLSVTTTFAGRARVGFLNVPAGTYQLRVAYDSAGTPRVKTRQVVAVSGGATLILR
jgi:hypothetical protein